MIRSLRNREKGKNPNAIVLLSHPILCKNPIPTLYTQDKGDVPTHAAVPRGKINKSKGWRRVPLFPHVGSRPHLPAKSGNSVSRRMAPPRHFLVFPRVFPSSHTPERSIQL